MSAARWPQVVHLVRGRTPARNVLRSIGHLILAAWPQVHWSQSARIGRT
jgi:hypothetical protein